MPNVKNFAKVTVSTGYDNDDTSIVLSSGHGALLPTVPFNVVWWNSTDYSDPSDDPNVEIVRVTARSTDTLTVTRAQEGTSGSTKNTSAKTYKMIAGLTALSFNGVPNTLYSTAVATGCAAVTETDLATFTMPASTLIATNQQLRITAWGTFANNGNGKVPKVFFGAQSLHDSPSTTSTGGWWVQAYVGYVSNTSQNGFCRMSYNGLSGNENSNRMTYTTPAETLSGSVVIKFTGASLSANDIVLKGFIVELVQ